MTMTSPIRTLPRAQEAAPRRVRSSPPGCRRLGVDPPLGVLQRPAGAAGAAGEDLGKDRERGLGGSMRADVEPRGAGDPVDVLFGHALCEQPLTPTGLVAARAQGADVERGRAERALERGDVEAILVREDHNRRLLVGLRARQDLLGPLDEELVRA